MLLLGVGWTSDGCECAEGSQRGRAAAVITQHRKKERKISVSSSALHTTEHGHCALGHRVNIG